MRDPVLEVGAGLVREFEGLRLEPYHDPVGYPTIGYGTLLSRKPWEDLSKYQTITVDEAEDLLYDDLAKANRSVLWLVSVELSLNQEAALTDFAYNCGSGNLADSTLRRVINRGEYDEAPKQFMRWVYSRGVKFRGLVRRRQAEVDLWLTR